MSGGTGRPEPVVGFLLFDSRSGSTLLAALLNQFRDVCVSHESRFFRAVVEYRGALSTDADVDRLVAHLFEDRLMREWGLEASAVAAALYPLDRPLERSAVVRAILRAYFAKHDPSAAVWLVKHAPYTYLDATRELLPEVRFVHVVRDGRGVFNSKRSSVRHDGEKFQSNLLKAARQWRLKMDLTRDFAARQPGSLVEVRYEDLVRSPDETMATILDFLGVPPEGRAVTKSQADYAKRIGGLQKALHANVQREPQGVSVDQWRTALAPAEIALYERICGTALKERGYPLVAAGGGDLRIALKVAGLRAYHTVHLAWLAVRNLARRRRMERSFADFLIRRIGRSVALLRSTVPGTRARLHGDVLGKR